MRHAYLIMAHSQPELLKKILRVLDHEENDFFIHLDIKSPLQPSDFVSCITKGRLYFTDRISITWGHFNMTKAEYLLLEKALEVGEHDYYHLITGQDFPLKPVEEINAFFAENRGKEFIHFSKDSFCQKKYVHRFVTKHPLIKFCGRTKNKWYYFHCLIALIQETFYKVIKPKWSSEKFLAGSQFFSITQEFAKFLVEHKSEVFKRYKYSLNGDESFVQTIAYNSKFKDNLYIKERNDDMHGNMRYVDWKNGANGSPATITKEYVPAALKSGFIFTRKVDIINHPEAIEMLEKAVTK